MLCDILGIPFWDILTYEVEDVYALAISHLRYLDITTLNTSIYSDLVKFHDKLTKERTDVVDQAKRLFKSGERFHDILARYE